MLSLKSGSSLESPLVHIKTKAPSKLAQPSILTTCITHHSVHLTWTKPEGVVVDKYRLLHREHGTISKLVGKIQVPRQSQDTIHEGMLSKLVLPWHDLCHISGTDENHVCESQVTKLLKVRRLVSVKLNAILH